MVSSTDLDSIPVETAVVGFAALADPIRLEIVNRLSEGGYHCVCELLRDSGVAANLLSYHLAVLRRAGLVSTRRRGRWVDYRLVPDALTELRRAVPGSEEA